MIKIEPQGQVYLCKTPLEADYKNQLTFANKTAQTTYFASTVVRSYDNNTYIRKDGGIKIACNAEDIRTCNYLFYQNTGFDNRIYYCFITSIEYLSENSTLVKFETDCFQTWYFDLVYKPCFVEREHVSDDTIGLHTVPEGLETGEYEILDLRNSPMYESGTANPDWMVCFAVTEYPNDGNNNPITNINGETNTIGSVFTGMHFFAVRTYAGARNVITIFNESGETLANAIKNIYLIPSCLVNINFDTGALATGGNPTTIASTSVSQGVSLYPIYDSYTSGEYQLQQPNHLSGNFVPKNNKLFTYPYTYFYVSNKAGEDVVYRWEDFPVETVGTGQQAYTARTCTYKKAMIASTSVSAKLYFTKYKTYSETSSYGTKMYNYGVNFAKVPVCAWTTDYYTNWLTQNGVNMNTNVVTSVASGAISGGIYAGALGAVVGGATSGLFSVISNLAKVHEASVIPDQASGDINAGDVMYAYTKSSISFYEMSIRKEYAEVIDEFFSMYGYKVNRVKTPSITGRTYWNYVKTVDCNIEGDVPQEDLQIVRNMFNKGCTFWHNATNMYNYNLTNSIVS